MVKWSAVREGWGVAFLVAGCLLVTEMPGCGSPVSDKPTNVDLRAENRKPEDRTGALQSSDGKSKQDNPTPTMATGFAGATPPPMAVPLQHDDDDLLNIPKAVAKDLNSSDARDRYRALDYWEEKDSKAPMDPVFDAMGDDDPAVRAKAAAIIERYTAAGEERE